MTDSQVRPGWVAGVGGEWAAWSRPWGDLIVKLEYLHLGFETHNYFDPAISAAPGFTVVTRSVKLSDDMVRVGANWNFNWGGPLIARY